MRCGLKTLSCCTLIPALALASSLGCGGSESTTPAESESAARPVASPSSGTTIPSNVAAATPQVPSGLNPAENPATTETATNQAVDIRPFLKYDSQNPLVGSWLGVAHMDPDILRQRLAKAQGAEQQELATIAQTFNSFQTALDLYNNGRMGMVVQGVFNGQEGLKEITGSWKVLEQQGNSFVVEINEEIAEGEVNTTQIRMIVSEDHQQMVRPAEIDERLTVCEPKFVFDRIPENYMEQVAKAQQEAATR